MAFTGFSVTGANTDTDVVAATTGKQIAVIRLMFTVSAAATVSFTNGADAAGTRIIYGDFAANGGIALPPAGAAGQPLYHGITTAGTALKVTNSAGNIKGTIEYILV